MSTCFECQKDVDVIVDVNAEETFERHVHWTPDDVDGDTLVFCSEECENSCFCERTEFPFVECPHCERYVCYQNPNNGYQVQFQKWKSHDDDEETSICANCYREAVIEHGQPRGDFEDKHGEASTFIGGGTWFDLDELSSFTCDPDFERFRIASVKDAMIFNARALELIDAQKSVIVRYGAMGIGGLEGYASIFVKKQQVAEQVEEQEKADEQEGRKKRKCE